MVLANRLQVTRASLFTDRERALTDAQADEFAEDLARLARGEPLAYVVGSAPFQDFDVCVGPAALIPRPETEMLADWAVARLRRRGLGTANDAGSGSAVVGTALDVGTGCGVLAIAMARAVPGLLVHATDTSPAALELAQKNALALGVADRVRFHLADLVPEGGVPDAHLVVANLPYVRQGDVNVQSSVIRYEPHEALFAGDDGLSVIRRLIARLPAAASPDADVGLEIAPEQAGAVLGLLRAAYPHHALSVGRDHNDKDRFVLAEDPTA